MKTQVRFATWVHSPWTATKQSIQRFLLIVFGSVLLAHALPAQVTYQYTGNSFSKFTKDGVYTATDHVTATLVLSAALPKSQSLRSIPSKQLVSLTLNDGAQTITQTSSSPDSKLMGVIFVSTDKKGDISGWDIYESVSNGPLIQTTNAGGASYDVGAKDRGIKTWTEGFIRSQPGNWVRH